MKLLAAIAVVGLAGSAHAEGTIVFARAGVVYEQDASGGGPAVKLAELPDEAAEVRWMEATRDGKVIAMDFGPFVSWLVAGQLRGGPCIGRARPAPAGDAVVCPGTDGVVVTGTVESVSHPLLGERLVDVSFRGPSGNEIAGLDGGGVVGIDLRNPAAKQILTTHGARDHLVIAPDGLHAVAVFGEKDNSRVRSFLLDGEGTARQLGGPGIPTLWSWDSTWVLFQEGETKNIIKGNGEDEGASLDGLEVADHFAFGAPSSHAAARRHAPPPPPKAPENRACVARGTGGEVKCWDDYTGLAFSPDSTQVLLRRDKSLYVGKIAGVRPEPPVKIIDGVDGAATWIPTPLKAPSGERAARANVAPR